MRFTTPCFVRVEDAEKRKELAEWLKGIGYAVCRCCLFDGWNTLHCGTISERDGGSEVHGIPDYDEETGSNIGMFKAENADKEHPAYDCGEDIELFKALAAMTDEDDINQYFANIIRKGYSLEKVRNAKIGYRFVREGDWDAERRAMEDEIIEHLNRNSYAENKL